MEKVIKRQPLHGQQGDTAYWLTRTPQERLDAVELLRLEWMVGRTDVVQGLQRVCHAVKRSRG